MTERANFQCKHPFEKGKVPYFSKGLFWCSDDCFHKELETKAEKARAEAKAQMQKSIMLEHSMSEDAYDRGRRETSEQRSERGRSSSRRSSRTGRPSSSSSTRQDAKSVERESRPNSARKAASSLTVALKPESDTGRLQSSSRPRSASAERGRNPILMNQRYETKQWNEVDKSTEKFTITKKF